MSDRERWIVYPLLFMALGIVLVDKITQRLETRELVSKAIDCDRIVCRSLIVTDAKGREQVALLPTTEGGLVQSTGRIELLGPRDKRPQALIMRSDFGGQLQLYGTKTGVQTLLSNSNEVAALVFVDAQGIQHPGSGLAVPRSATPAPSETKKSE